MEFSWSCTWTRTMRTRPMTEGLSLVELSCVLVPVYRFTLGRRNPLRFFYGGRVCGDGHGFSRDDFHAVSLEFYFPGPRCWVYHGE